MWFRICTRRTALSLSRAFFRAVVVLFTFILKMRKDDAIVWQLPRTTHNQKLHTPVPRHPGNHRIQLQETINKIKVNNDGKSTSSPAIAEQGPERERAIEWHRQQTAASSNFLPIGKSNAIFILYHLRTFRAAGCTGASATPCLFVIVSYKYISLSQL